MPSLMLRTSEHEIRENEAVVKFELISGNCVLEVEEVEEVRR